MEAQGMNYPTNWLMRARRKYLREAERDYPHKGRVSNLLEKLPRRNDLTSNNKLLNVDDDGPDEFSPDAIFGEN
jgi:hypothetical protein